MMSPPPSFDSHVAGRDSPTILMRYSFRSSIVGRFIRRFTYPSYKGTRSRRLSNWTAPSSKLFSRPLRKELNFFLSLSYLPPLIFTDCHHIWTCYRSIGFCARQGVHRCCPFSSRSRGATGCLFLRPRGELINSQRSFPISARNDVFCFFGLFTIQHHKTTYCDRL